MAEPCVDTRRLVGELWVVNAVVENALPDDLRIVARVSGQHDAGGPLKRLGDAVRAARAARAMSQEALADAAGIDRSHMGKIERGERNITFMNIARVATALDKLPSELLAEAGL